MILPTTIARERIGWLECLIHEYEDGHDWSSDPDPAATREMLQECKAILAELESLNREPEPAEAEPIALDPEIPF